MRRRHVDDASWRIEIRKNLFVDDAVIVLQQALHAIALVAHLLPLCLGLLVIEVLLHQGVILGGSSTVHRCAPGISNKRADIS